MLPSISRPLNARAGRTAHRGWCPREFCTGFTALHHAGEYGSLDAARVLLAAGADPKHTNLEGVTPLARARQEGHVDVAELLEAAERGVRPKDP